MGGEEVPEGAAVFPSIPRELGVDPMLLALLHCVIFLAGSTSEILDPAAADEALGFVSEYLDRLNTAERRAAEEDLRALMSFAREEKWPRPLIEAIKSFRSDFGLTTQTDS